MDTLHRWIWIGEVITVCASEKEEIKEMHQLLRARGAEGVKVAR